MAINCILVKLINQILLSIFIFISKLIKIVALRLHTKKQTEEGVGRELETTAMTNYVMFLTKGRWYDYHNSGKPLNK